MTRTVNAVLLPLSMIAVAVCVGCDSGPNRPLSGTVTLDGQPLPTGRITFDPLGSGPTAGGRIEDGEYRIGAAQGPLPGKYLVRISSHQPTGRILDHPESADGKYEETKEVVPPQYNDFSELSITVTDDGDNKHDFELKSN